VTSEYPVEQLQEGNGSYIVSYFDDDDDDIKAKMIPVITGATGTISISFRKYLRNIPGKHEIKEVQKKAILDITQICTAESTNVRGQKYVTCEITLHIA